MSTIEKLVAQIFERKKSIIEQVTHQVELYDQQLASKCFLHGIEPPSWLWNNQALDSQSAKSNVSEIKKQRLIKELLLPYPQHAIPSFDDFMFDSTSIPAFKHDLLDEPLNQASVDEVINVPNVATELEPTASSPQHQVAARSVDINVPSLSRPEFKRSKSRNRALELQSSAKSGPKHHCQDENISSISSRKSTPYMHDFKQCNNDENQEPEKACSFHIEDGANSEAIQHSKKNKAAESLTRHTIDHVCDSMDRVCLRRSVSGVSCGQVGDLLLSDNLLKNHQEGATLSQEIKTLQCEEYKASESIPTQMLDHVCDSIDRACRISSGAVSSGQANNSILPENTVDNHHGGDTESSRIKIRSYVENKNSKLIPDQMLDSVDHVCKSDSGGALSSGRISHSVQSHEDVTGLPVGDTSSEDMMIQSYKENNTSKSVQTQKSIHLSPKFSSDIKEGHINRVFSSCNTLADVDQVQEPWISSSPSGVLACKEEGSHDYSCRISGTESSGAKSLKLETLSAIPEGCNMLLDEMKMHDKEAQLVFRQSKSVELPCQQMEEASLSFQAEWINVDDMEEESAKKIVGSPLEKTESIVQGKHDMLLEPAPISFQSGGSIISMEGSWPQQEHTTAQDQPNYGSSGPSGFFDNLINDSNACSCVDVDNSACEFDYFLLQKDLHDQATSSGIQTICSHLPSILLQHPSNILLKEDNIVLEGVEETTAATESLVAASTSSVSEMISQVITEDSQMNLSEQVEERTDSILKMEKKTGCTLDDSRLFQDREAKLDEGRAENDSFSDGKGLLRESYTTDFEGNGFVDASKIDKIESEQTMPVFEGFFMDSNDGVSPMSDFPITYRLHKTSDLYQSVPNGLLEHMPLVSDYGSIQFPQKPHSAHLPVSTGPFSFDVEAPYVSPVRKLWDQSSSNSSTKKQQCSNPELVCFTIEEDPGNCEEIGICEEVAEVPVSEGSCSKSVLKQKPISNIFTIEEDPRNFEEIEIGEEIAEAPVSDISFSKSSPKRKPLSDITENCQNPPLSVSSTVQFQFRSHKDSTSSEANFTGACSKVKQKLESKFSNNKSLKNDAKENNKFLVGGNGVKRDAESKRETRSQKPKLSEIPNTGAGTSYAQKLPRPNNIVSNMTSFVPLVQEKKAAAAATGKRDVRVKALEAAEAARRLEEKKENERKMKKEAWKAEKARLEQQNLLQLEVQKKKKEEEQKKKEAEMAARKRQREEEEKKEKEGKRRRVEEAWKQQQEQEKKLRLLAKETRHQAAGGRRVHEKKELGTDLDKCRKLEICGDKARVNIEGEKAVLNPKGDHFPEISITLGDGGSLKMLVDEPGTANERNLRTKAEPSYEISPYQGSDDEYEVEDDGNDILKEKFVPAWASKISRVEAVFAQQHINPFQIFPPESFCSISEVLVPRKLQAKLRGK